MRNVDDSGNGMAPVDVMDDQLGATRQVCERLVTKLLGKGLVPPAEPTLPDGHSKLEALWNLHRWRQLLRMANQPTVMIPPRT